jgi:MOSC domain-containing protein YiiM/ferredoxin-NADP reductase
MRVLSVNLAQVRTLEVRGRTVETGIYKVPVSGVHDVDLQGINGDTRIEPRRHFGDENHAVHIYPYEHYPFWEEHLKKGPFGFGQLGENLTTLGLLETEVRIGDVLRIGSCVLQVAQPRIPCRKLSARMEHSIVRTFLETRRTGFFLRVLSPGQLAAGDAITLLSRDDASPTVDEFVRISQFDYWDVQGLKSLLLGRDLPQGWIELLQDKIERASAADGWFGQRELCVVRCEDESDGFVSYELCCARGRPLPRFLGGQFLMMSPKGAAAQNVVRRPCSLSGDPRDTSFYRVTLQDPPEERLHIGDHVRAAAPRGSFVLSAAAPDASGFLFLSSGGGMAAMASMLRQWWREGAERPAYLFHDTGAGLPRALYQKLMSLPQAAPRLFLQSGSLGPACSGLADVLDEKLPLLGPRCEVFVSGPEPFKQSVQKQLLALHVDPERLHIDPMGSSRVSAPSEPEDA